MIDGVFGYACRMVRVSVAVLALVGCSYEHGLVQDGDAPIPDASVEWWDPAYSIRIPLLIQTPTTVPLGYQVGVAVDLPASPCSGNRDAVRVVLGRTELTRVIDGYGASDMIWFKLVAPIPAGSDVADYYLYCGNPNPTSAPADPAQVFDTFDDFDGTALGPMWSNPLGTVVVAAGSLTIPPSTNGVASQATFGVNTAVDFVGRASVGAATTPYFWAGFGNGYSFNIPWARWFGGNAPNTLKASTADVSATDGTVRTLDTLAHLYGIEHFAGDTVYRIDNAVVESIKYGNTIPALAIVLINHNSGGSVEFEMVRTRRAVKPAPTVTLGAPERQ